MNMFPVEQVEIARIDAMPVSAPLVALRSMVARSWHLTEAQKVQIITALPTSTDAEILAITDTLIRERDDLDRINTRVRTILAEKVIPGTPIN